MGSVLARPPALVWLAAAAVCLSAMAAVVAVVSLRARRAAAEQGSLDRLRGVASTVVSHLLLWFFWGVAAGLSANNLVGFGRDQMRLSAPWPYLLYFALDGAAAFVAVLIMRRARRDEPAAMLRLFVWAEIAGSAWANETHSPPSIAARAAFAAFPVIAAVLFEFALAKLKRTSTKSRRDRRMTAVRWLHPVERVRVQMALASDEHLPASEATHRVRVERAARRLYALRRAVNNQARRARLQSRICERRAQAALTRVRFADPDIAAEVLGHVQVLARTRDLAVLDYSASPDVHAMLDGFLTAAPATPGAPGRAATTDTGRVPAPIAAGASAANGSARSVPGAVAANGRRRRITASQQAGLMGPESAPASRPAAGGAASASSSAGHDGELLAAAREILAASTEHGGRLTQAALARALRDRGFSIANHRLSELAAQIGLRKGRTSKDTAHAS